MPPEYVSTRGAGPVSFESAVLAGQPSDGGLYVPTAIPTIEIDARYDLAALAQRVLLPWMDEKLSDAASNTLDRVFDFPIRKVDIESTDLGRVEVVELFHGPTGSFKDYGARFLAHVANIALTRRSESRTVLVATSGDTGSAVADAFAGDGRIRVVVLFPEGQISPFQRWQLTQPRRGVTTLSVQGTFDDCQAMVKYALAHPSAGKLGLTSANSINVGRLLPQMVYYFWALGGGVHTGRTVCVPSGNLGSLTAGYLASLTGLPIQRFIAAHNSNDWFPRFLKGSQPKRQETVATLSNAMDVAQPSNAERLLAIASKRELSRAIWPTSIGDQETLETMKAVFDQTGYVVDPHTAVGFAAIRQFRRKAQHVEPKEIDQPIVLLSTARPAKFAEIVQQATGNLPETPPEWERLTRNECNVESIPASERDFMALLQRAHRD